MRAAAPLYITDSGRQSRPDASAGLEPAHHLAGLLKPKPSPAAPAAVAAFIHCSACDGDGVQRMVTGSRLSNWWVAPCWACHGGATVPGYVIDRGI